MSITKKIIAGLLLIATVATASAQRVISVPMPVVGNVPAAIAATGNYPDAAFNIRGSGRLAVACTRSEVKVWVLPEGKLIYRFQRPAVSDPSQEIQLNGELKLHITGDEKYMYAASAKEVAETETGELLPAGGLRDSILNSSYDTRRGYYESIYKLSADLHNKFVRVAGSPLALKRDYKSSVDESIELIAVQKDPLDKDVLNIIYSQSRCGSKDWIKNVLEKDVQDVRSRQEKRGYCTYYDNCWASYNVITGKAIIRGIFTDPERKGEKAYSRIDEAYISPFGDVAAAKYTGSSFSIFAPDGQALWSGAEKAYAVFDHFDGVGDVVMKQESNVTGGKGSINVHDANTGKIVTTYELPGTHRNTKMGLVEQLGMVSHISKTGDGDFAITLHVPETGKLMISLTDAEATKSFSQKHKAESAFLAEQNRLRQEAYRRQQQDFYNQSVADHNRAYNKAVAENSGSATAADPNACRECNGTGWVMKKGFLYNKETSEYSSGAGSGSVNYKVTSTPVYSDYTSRAVCAACGGRGKKR